jgi:hypothetical protein
LAHAFGSKDNNDGEQQYNSKLQTLEISPSGTVELYTASTYFSYHSFQINTVIFVSYKET